MRATLRSSADYKRALMVPIAAGILLMLMIFVGAELLRQRSDLEQDRSRSVAVVRTAFALAVERDTDKLTAVLDAVVRDPALQLAYLANDRQKLWGVADPLFQSLRKNHDITHFYFIRPDRRMFLRVQAPDRFDDMIERRTLLAAEQTGQTSSGLELGSLGVFTLRVVSPWRDAAGILLGYIELGVEIDRTVARLHSLTGVGMFMLIDKTFLDRDRWNAGMKMIGRKGQWDQFSSHVLVGATPNADPGWISEDIVRSVMSREGGSHQAEVAGRAMAFESAPMKAFGDGQVGHMLIATDLTEERARETRFLALVVTAALLVGVLLLVIANRVLDHVYGRLAKSRAERDVFIKKAQRDGLTRLYRRDVFFRRLGRQCADAQRDGKPLTVLMIDVDWFKRVNDTYGHPVGDQVLRGIAQMIRHSVRPGDMVARYGGEEFSVILADMEGDAASIVAERIRTSVEVHPFHCEAGTFSVSLSVGGAVLPDDGSTADELVAAADRALYTAKHSGRNQTRIGVSIRHQGLAAQTAPDRQ